MIIKDIDAATIRLRRRPAGGMDAVLTAVVVGEEERLEIYSCSYAILPAEYRNALSHRLEFEKLQRKITWILTQKMASLLLEDGVY